MSRMVRIKRRLQEVCGVYDGEYAFKGPRCVQIDITNKCNNDCIGCWCNSPLLEERRLPSDITDATLPTETVYRLLDDLSEMGTEEIYFAGGGEPFMHPDAVDIFVYAKKKGFHVSVNTNFTLVDTDAVDRLVEAAVDHLIVSVWAGTPEVYSATHPNRDEADFLKLKKTLQYLNEKKGGGGNAPVIKVYHVMFNMNYKDFERMIDFVKETGSEAVEFTLLDTIPGKTDKLSLSREEASELLSKALKMKEKWYHKESGVWMGNYDTFIGRVKGIMEGSADYDKENVCSIDCFAGWAFARVIASGDVNSCLKSHRIPIGNLHKARFSDLWNNSRQREFRRRTRDISEDNPYLRFIGNDPSGTVGCFRSCDNMGHSMLIRDSLDRIKPPYRLLLKSFVSVAGLLRRKRGA